MAPDRIHVTNVIVNDTTSARAWGHCTVRGCKATMSCGVSWQPDHAIFTCFTKKSTITQCHQNALGGKLLNYLRKKGPPAIGEKAAS